jgi:ATP-dependent Zn protease
MQNPSQKPRVLRAARIGAAQPQADTAADQAADEAYREAFGEEFDAELLDQLFEELEGEDMPDDELRALRSLNEGTEPPADKTPPRCDQMLAWYMVDAALQKINHTLQPGFHILLVQHESWVPVVEAVLKTAYIYGPHGSFTAMRASRRSRPVIQLLGTRAPLELVRPPAGKSTSGTPNTPSTPGTPPAPAPALEDTTCACLATGKAACLVTAALDQVPDDLHASADRILAVPPPSRRLLAKMLKELAPPARRLPFGGYDYARLTPTMLRLAYRPAIEAPAYLRGLQRMLPTPASTTPANPERRPLPLAELHGIDAAKQWAASLKADLNDYRQGRLPWAEVPSSALLSGPPGTAKTTLARAIAADCALAFVGTSYADWQSAGHGHLGDVMRSMRAAFHAARAQAPALLFIDELDSVGARGHGAGQRDDWWRSIINGVLEELDGRADNTGVVVMAASNHPEMIDPALLRAGRMERHIVLPLPDANALAAIFRDQLRPVGALEGFNLEQLGQICLGMSGADIVRLCTEARRRARQQRRLVEQQDLLHAIAGDASPRSTSDEWRIAVHEAGHGVMVLLSPVLELAHLSIVRQGERQGNAVFKLRGETATPAALQAYIVALLAGRAAEELLLGEVSSGAGGASDSDLGYATRLAADAELTLGLGEQRLVWFDLSPPARLSTLLAQRPDIERQVNARLAQAYREASATLAKFKPELERMARRLLECRSLSKREALACMQGNPLDPADRLTAASFGSVQSHAIH